MFGQPRPKELHPFRAIHGVHEAVSTPGDLLLHIRADTTDQCFKLATPIMARIGRSVTVVDETRGFKFFDDHDLLGFVDGTENPTGKAILDATLIRDENAGLASGNYVIVQKYLHDPEKWNALPVKTLEGDIGRKKLSDIELEDSVKPRYAHNVLNVITDDEGNQPDILRDNMPFGDIGKGEFGTFFIGYACFPSRTERMLDNMFVGNPPGNYARILDYSRAVTGTLFFVPAAGFLDAVTPGAPATAAPAGTGAPATTQDTSPGIGSLRDED